MKKSTSSNSKVLAGKGFYIALSLSVAMIGAACYFAYTQTSNQLSAQLESTAETESTDDQAVHRVQTSVPKLTTTLMPMTTTTIVTTTTVPVTQAALADPAEPVQVEPTVTEPVQNAAPAPVPSVPVAGEVLSPFSGGELVKSNTTGAWQTHNGIDIAAALGEPVTVALPGTITEICQDGLWGVCITVDHGNGIFTRYCGLNKDVPVTAGTILEAGTQIGSVGDTAEIESSDPSHLHFEVKENGKYLDPAVFLEMSES